MGSSRALEWIQGESHGSGKCQGEDGGGVHRWGELFKEDVIEYWDLTSRDYSKFQLKKTK